MTSKVIIISAVNFTEGGPLTVFRDSLKTAAELLPSNWKIIALVHNKKLFNETRVHYIEFPNAKRSWLLRLYYEWFAFYALSKKLKPDLWLSMHDITPNVKAVKKAVYCHNPSPFYRYPFKDILLSPKLWLFNKFYKYLYAINIRKNDFVIVQQNWLRDEFVELYGPLNIIVAYPNTSTITEISSSGLISKKNIFLYPAFPRVFKNFEVICKAVEMLQLKSVNDFEVVFTISGNENSYSRMLKNRYGNVSNISFAGVQDQKSMVALYEKSKAIIFPSKLETWGLPISEAKAYGKHLLVADLPYAKETLGTYAQVSFFTPEDEKQLANLIESVLNDSIIHDGNIKSEVKQPFAGSWNDLWFQLIGGL